MTATPLAINGVAVDLIIMFFNHMRLNLQEIEKLNSNDYIEYYYAQLS